MTRHLLQHGPYTQATLRAALLARGVRCTQGTISHIAHGKHEPKYTTGRAIEAIYADFVGDMA